MLFLVEFEDLWKFHAPVNIVEGFDVSLFDKLIEVKNKLDMPGFYSYWSKVRIMWDKIELETALHLKPRVKLRWRSKTNHNDWATTAAKGIENSRKSHCPVTSSCSQWAIYFLILPSRVWKFYKTCDWSNESNFCILELVLSGKFRYVALQDIFCILSCGR